MTTPQRFKSEIDKNFGFAEIFQIFSDFFQDFFFFQFIYLFSPRFYGFWVLFLSKFLIFFFYRKIETTLLPDWESGKKRTDADEEVESSQRKPQEENVRGALTITINTPDWLFNKSKKLIRNPGFGVTYVNLATSTLASVSLSTLTQGATTSFFIVSRCVPIGFPYPSCAQVTVDGTDSLME